MTVSVIIRCYNEERHIGRLLSGIMQQSLGDLEIVVVDSGSTDTTLSIASKYPVRILSINPYEFSFGRSINLGCKKASGDLLVFASAHVYPLYNDWLERLTYPFNDPKVALVYGRQCGNNSTRHSEKQVFAKWFPEETNMNQDQPFCNNANAAVRKSIWEDLPYDETLTGLEDLDWAVRAMKLGHKVAYIAEAEVAHIHNESYSQVYNRYCREAMALKQIIPSTKFSLFDLGRLLSANIVSDYFSLVIKDKVDMKNMCDIPIFRLMQFWGTYRGYAQQTPLTERLRRKFYYPNHRMISSAEEKLNPNGQAKKRIPIEYENVQIANR